jgi:hypothetical protein
MYARVHMHIICIHTYCAKCMLYAYHIMYASYTNTQHTHSQTHTAGPKLLKSMVERGDIVKRLEKVQLLGYFLVTAAAEKAAGLLSRGYAATLQVTMATTVIIYSDFVEQIYQGTDF